MDFESIMKVIVAVSAGLAFPALAFLIVRAAMAGVRRLEGKGPSDSELAHKVEDLQRDLTELQERVDFAERVLSQQREMERLPPGGT